MPTTTQIADVLFKKQLGLGTTSSGRLFFNEPIRGRSFVVQSQLWAQSDLIPNTAPGTSAGVVQKLVDYPLALVAGTTNSFTGALLQDAIPFNWGDGTSYNYTVKDSTASPIAFGVNDWVVDTEAGILMFNSGVPANMPPTISFFRYSGAKGASTGSFVSTGQTGQFASAVNLASTGAFLQSEIVIISGTTGAFITTSQTGAFASSVNLGTISGRVNSISGTTQNLSGQTQGLSGQISTVQSLTTNLSGQTFGLSGQISYVQTLTTSLSGQTQALSGQTQGLSGQILTINNKTGTFVTDAETGQFYASNNPSGFVTSGQLGGLNTGSFITTGQTGQFYASNNPSQFVTSGQLGGLNTGSMITTGQTGAFASSVNLTTVSGQVQSVSGTTQNLSGQIQGLSGQIVTVQNLTTNLSGQTAGLSGQIVAVQNYATSVSGSAVNLSGQTSALSGQTQGLQGQITTINNKTGAFVVTGQTGQFASTVNLAATGAFLQSEIVIISGTTGAFITTNQTGAFASIVNLNTTGTIIESKLAIVSGTTGAFITTSQTGAFASSVNLATISGQVQSVSGTTQALSGQTQGLQSQITTINNKTGTFITSAQTGGFASAINLTTISGQVQSVSGTTQALSGQTQGLQSQITTINNKTGSFVLTGEQRDVLLSGFTVLNDIARLAPDQTGRMTIVYPNVGVFATLGDTITGALVFNTPIYRTENRRVSFLVQGGDTSQGIDTTSWFRVSTRIATGVGITGSDGVTGAVVSANMIALGDNNVPKWIGINQSGYLALVIGTTGYTQNYTRYMLDIWVGDENPRPIRTGWTWSLETGSKVNFGFLHLSGLTNSAPFITGSQSSFVTTSMTGQFYASNNPQQFISTGNADARYALAAKTGTFITTAQTGAFASVTNLTSTGAILSGQIVALSGQVVSISGQTQALSGQTQGLQSQITTINNKTGVFVTTAQTGAFASVINLTSTGQTLQNQITALSGTVVFTTGDQTIDGTKTFNVPIVAPSITNFSRTLALDSGILFNSYGGPNHPVLEFTNAAFTITGNTAGWAIGGTQLSTYAIRNTYGTASEVSLYDSRLRGNDALVSVDWSGWQLYESTGGSEVLSIDWANRIAYGLWRFPSGLTVSGQPILTGSASNFVSISQTGAFASAVNLTTISGRVDSVSGTTQALSGQTQGLQSQITTINNKTGTFITSAQTGGFASSTNLTTISGQVQSVSGTTQNLSGQTQGLSGQIVAVQNYATSVSGSTVNLSGQTAGISGQLANVIARTGGFVVVAQTGQFYAANNPSGFITAAQAGGVQSLTVTGLAISGAITLTGTSGVGLVIAGSTITIGVSTGQFYASSNPSQFVTSGQLGGLNTGSMITTGQTGQFASTVNLVATGAFLQSEIVIISGTTGAFITTSQTGAFASVTNLNTTGTIIESKLAIVSGTTGAFITTSQTGSFASSVNLTTISGRVDSVSGTTQALTGQTQSLQSQITTINNKTGTFISTAQTGAFASITNLAATGAFLQSEIVFISGATGGFVRTGETRDVLLSGFTVINDLVRLAPDQTGQMTVVYPNVGVFQTTAATMTGALVFNTPIYRTENRRVSFVVQGGDSSQGVDTTSWFRLSARILSGAGLTGNDGVTGIVTSANVIALGDSNIPKWVGINKSGYLAFALGTTGYTQDWTRYYVDVWVGDNRPVPVKTGWNWTIETGLNFQFKFLSGLNNSAPFTSGAVSNVTGLATGLASGGYLSIPDGRTYLTGTKSLLVFVNGEIQYITDEYVETNPSGITFQYNVPADSKVLFNITR